MKKIQRIDLNTSEDWPVLMEWIENRINLLVDAVNEMRVEDEEEVENKVTMTNEEIDEQIYRPSNLQEECVEKGTVDITWRSADYWPEWIEEKKREFWDMFRMSLITDSEAVYYARNGRGVSVCPTNLQLRMMYLYVLEEYCKENKISWVYSELGFEFVDEDWEAPVTLKQAEKDMKPVLDKLKGLLE